jgi:hypothetical protein
VKARHVALVASLVIALAVGVAYYQLAQDQLDEKYPDEESLVSYVWAVLTAALVFAVLYFASRLVLHEDDE